MNDNYSPVIKWSGSKRSQAKAILDNFPKVIETYYEPFIGGGSILNAVMHSDIKVNKYICSDINSDLINLYKAIMTNPDNVASHYKKLWNELNVDDDLSRKRQYFEMIRERLNTEEATENNELINFNLESMLAPRKEACRLFNKLFNLEGDKAIDVKVRSDLFNVIKQEESIITGYNKNPEDKEVKDNG